MLYDEDLEDHVIGPRVPRRYLTALDLQINLLDALTEDTPSGAQTRSWFVRTFDSMIKVMPAGDRRALAASGPVDHDSNGWGFVLAMQEALNLAPTYHIEPNMMGFISDVADSMPDDVAPHPEDMPSRHGWVHFQTPVQVIDRWGKEYLIRAVLWSAGSDTAGFGITDWAGTWEDPELKQTIREDQQRLKEQGRPWYPPELSIFHIDTVKWGEPLTSPEALSKDSYMLRDYSQQPDAPAILRESRMPNDDEIHALMSTAWMRRFIVAAWMVMQGKIGRPRRAAPSKIQQKALRKRDFDWGDIRVVSLRATEYGDPDEDRGKIGRQAPQWNHRWGVRGFWRWQWYPSAPGPCPHCGKENGEHRRKWIDPYVKGPEHLPYIAKDPVYVVNR